MKNLKALQLNIISEFCSDIAKGLMLAAILGQATFRMVTIDWGTAYNTVFIVGGFVGIVMAVIAIFLKKSH